MGPPSYLDPHPCHGRSPHCVYGACSDPRAPLAEQGRVPAHVTRAQ